MVSLILSYLLTSLPIPTRGRAPYLHYRRVSVRRMGEMPNGEEGGDDGSAPLPFGAGGLG
jgi:hypothetical protein